MRILPGVSSLWLGRLSVFLMLLITVLQTSRAQSRHDLFIPVGGSDSLDATYVVPATPPPAGGYPLLLFVHGFGGSKASDTANCIVYARMGFLALTYSVRGHGSSSGLSTIMGSQERLDLRTVLQWAKRLPDVDSTAIGIAGGSQGGLHGLWAVADRLRIRATSADVIVSHWASDLFANGSIRRLMLFLLKTPTVRYTAERDTLWELVRQDAYDALLSRFATGRDIEYGAFDSSNVPLLLLLKFQDHYFNPSDGIAQFENYPATRKLYLGTGGHFSDPSTAEQTRQSSFVTRWMRHFLMGDQNGITDEKPVSFAESTLPQESGYFTWEPGPDLDQWPPLGVVLRPLYFGVDSTLSFTPPPGPIDTVEVANDYRDTTYTFDKGFIEGFKGSVFDAALPTVCKRFYSDVLTSNMIWAGAPILRLNVLSDRAAFPVHARIFEVDTAGNARFINRVNFTARHWTPGMQAVTAAEGIVHAHRFQQGSRIMVELTNIDRDPPERPETGGQAFVVPLLTSAHPKIIVGGSQPSYVALPLVQDVNAVVAVDRQVPEGTSLIGNWPNPFNPATTIDYTIGQRQDFGTLGGGDLGRNVSVQLIVYDVLGREVRTLVNEPQAPGHYEIRFDGANLASGVYFYRLTAGGFTAARRMVLVR